MSAPTVDPVVAAGNTAFMTITMAMVLVMTPALGVFYGGLGRSRDVLSMMQVCILCLAIVTIQWYLFGFSLAFSASAYNGWIGNFDNGALTGIGAEPHPSAPGISGLAFFVYQMQFAGITPALFVGAGAGRIRVLPLMLIFLLWTTIVYDPLAYAVWGPNGWLRLLGGTGVYDFAGGLPIHTGAGVAALVYGWMLGAAAKTPMNPPPSAAPFHAPILVYISTGLLWFGWMGFNGGSALAATPRAVIATINSNVSASVCGLMWMLLEYIHTKKWGSVAFCTGAVAGLATVTPASGFVPVWAAVVIGALAALICQRIVLLKYWLRLDVDALDVFAVHGVGGILGTFLTGIFASTQVIALDGTILPGGGISGHWMQLPYQLAGIGYCAGYSAVVTFMICAVVDRIPGFKLRADPAAEGPAGVDATELGEHAYAYHALPMGLASGVVGLHSDDGTQDPDTLAVTLAELTRRNQKTLDEQNRIDNLQPPSDDD
jgi:ammonium transporter, Amt family